MRTHPVAAAAVSVQRFVDLISLDVDLERTRQLQLRARALTRLPSHLGSLLPQLRKLDLSHNDLDDVAALCSLPHLSNLTLSHNARLRTLDGLRGAHLVVLVVPHCGLCSLAGLEASAATLRTLIANDNALQLLAAPTVTAASAASAAPQRSSAARRRSKAAAVTAAPRTTPATSVSHDVDNNNDHDEKKSDDGDMTRVMARRNYAVLASLTVCETIVLSRNAQLCALYDDDDSNKDNSNNNDDDTRAQARPHTSETQHTTSARTHKGDDTNDDNDNNNVHAAAAAAAAAQHPLAVFAALPHLKKLSLSACHLRTLPVRWFLPLVTELRLAHNALTSLQPDGVIARSLKILDVSHNALRSIATLRRCRFLRQLSVAGNPLLDEYVRRDAAEATHTDDDKDNDNGDKNDSNDEDKSPRNSSSNHNHNNSKGKDDDDGRKRTPDTSSVSHSGDDDGEQRAHTQAASTGNANATHHAGVPRSLQRVLRRMFTQLTLVDGQPLLPDEQLRKRTRHTSVAPAPTTTTTTTTRADEGRGDDEVADAAPRKRRRATPTPSSSAGATSDTARVGATRDTHTHTDDNDDNDNNAGDEEDVTDVVMAPPDAVVRVTHAAIVRRERVLLPPSSLSSPPAVRAAVAANAKASAHAPGSHKSGTVVVGSTAVQRLLSQRSERRAW